MNNVNSVLLSGILAALSILILQNAGVIRHSVQDASGPMEVMGVVRIEGTPTVKIGQGYGDRLDVKIDPLSPLSVDLAYLGGHEMVWSESGRVFGTVFTNKETGKQFVEPVSLGRVAIKQETFDPPIRMEIDQGLPVTPIKVDLSSVAGRNLVLTDGLFTEDLGVENKAGSSFSPDVIDWGKIGVSSFPDSR